MSVDGPRQGVRRAHGGVAYGRDHVACAQVRLLCWGTRPYVLHAGRRGSRVQRDAQVRVHGLAVRDQLAGDRAHRIGGDREADAGVVARVATDLRVDADHLALRVQQRAAGVAVVDRGVGLDRVGDAEAPVERGDRAVQRADDPGGDGLLQPEGASDRHYRVTHDELARAADRERVQLGSRGVYLQHGEIRRAVAADELGAVGLAVPELDRKRLSTFDDVVVRDDVTTRVVDE